VDLMGVIGINERDFMGLTNEYMGYNMGIEYWEIMGHLWELILAVGIIHR
jgi:hypothetical protein